MIVLTYIAKLTLNKIILWCYLLWYLVTLYFYFDPSSRIWLNAVGISVVIGIALSLGVSRPAGSQKDNWQTIRLFLTPFCVSSFSALTKDHNFILVIPPKPTEQITLLASCLCFVALVYLVKAIFKNKATPNS